MTVHIDETHDPALTSWLETANGHRDFPIQNLPLGIFAPKGAAPRPGVAIGSWILDIAAAASQLPEPFPHSLAVQHLNLVLALAPNDRLVLRRHLSQLLSDERHRGTVTPLLHEASACSMYLPALIGDYTDFYVGIHHATNVGKLFRPDNPLLPNYKYLPIGYHGRSSSVRISGTTVCRPHGQQKVRDQEGPYFGPSRRLDYELELGVWIGSSNALGTPIPIKQAHKHIAGLSLLNDWSARDLQAWEYQPLGPFLAKNFLTTISPWIVTSEALAPFRTAQPARPEGDPQPLDYLWDANDQARGAYQIDLEVLLLTAKMRREGHAPHRLSSSAASHMYWTPAQLVTHHTSNGCNLNSGDLLGTGTISGPTTEGFGSLLELGRGGNQPITLPNGEQRSFLEDGDEVILTGAMNAEGFVSIGFGECRGIVSDNSCSLQ